MNMSTLDNMQAPDSTACDINLTLADLDIRLALQGGGQMLGGLAV